MEKESEKLQLHILFEGLNDLNKRYHLLGNYVNHLKLEEEISFIIRKSLYHHHDIDHVANIVLRYWIPSLHRFIEKRSHLIQHYPYDLDLEVGSLLIKSGYPETEQHSDE